MATRNPLRTPHASFPPGRAPLETVPSPPPVPEDRTGVVKASLWMMGITLALFFLPVINCLVGGIVGGYKVGSVGRALAAAVLPAIVAAVGLALIFGLFNAPLLGFFAGATVGLLILFSDLGLFIGAAIGGAISPKRPV